MKTRWLVVFGFVFLGLSACHKAGHGDIHSGKVLKIEDLPEDIRIPAAAYRDLEMKAIEDTSTRNIIFSNVSVHLTEKNTGVLTDSPITIHFPKGGGAIDLAEFVTGSKGSFFVRFDFPEFNEATQKKILFVSQARKRRLGDQIFGAGCNQYFDLTTSLLKLMETGPGIKVNSVRERYTSVLGGTFLFSALKDNSVYLAQVTFKDSSHPHLYCEEL